MDRSALVAAGVSRREMEVLDVLRARPTNAELAATLYISERTVESHISSLLRKLAVASRLELAKLAAEVAQAESLAARLPAPLELLADPESFFGRSEELARLVSAWNHAAAGRVLVRVVTGEAGIGKSRLVAELSAQVHQLSGLVLLGSCTEDSPTPFEPFWQALANSPIRGKPATEDVFGAAAVDRGQQLDDADANRAEIAGRVTSALIGLAKDQPTLVVVEDLHWATPSTQDTVLHVARASTPCPLLMVVTARDSPPDLNTALAQLLGELDRLPTVERVPLGGLEESAVSALLGWLGEEDDALVVSGETGGNPLLLRERATLGRSSGSLQSLLAQRDRLLPEADLRVLDVAAAIGVEIPVELLAAATTQAAAEVVDTLERAAEAGIVASLSGRAGLYTFVHALFRSVRYERLATGHRMRVHADIAAALQRHGNDPDAWARHACLAAPLHDAAVAAQLALEAGDRIGNLNDPDAAGRRYEWGLDVVDLAEPPQRELRLRLNVRHGQSLALRGDARARDVLLDAVREARAIGDGELMAEAALSMSPVPGGAATPGRPDTEFTAIAEEALARLPVAPSVLTVRLLAALGVQLRLGSDRHRGMMLANQAVRDARDLGDEMALAHALLAWRYGGTAHNRVVELEAHGEELAAIGVRSGHPLFVHAGLWMKAAAQRQRGDLASVTRTLARAPRVETPWARLSDEALSISDCLLAGDLVKARRRLDGFAAVTRSQGEAFALLSALTETIIAHYEGTLADRAGTRARHQPATEFVLVDAIAAIGLAQAGQRQAASEMLDHYLSAPPEASWRADYSYLLAVAAFADAASFARREAATEPLLALLDPHAGELAAVNAFVSGSIDYHRADLALLQGDRQRAASIAARAVTASRARGTPLFLGRELALLAAATGADRPRHEAEEIAKATGSGLIALDLDRRASPRVP